MKKLYLLCLTLFSFSSFASHLLGVDISWECVGTNQYVFIVDQYVHCVHNIAVTHAPQTVTGPTGNIQLPYAGSTNISLPCAGSPNCLSPSSSYIARNRFRSAPVTLPGSPPPSGWEFTHGSCCFGLGVNVTSSTLLSVKARMYPNGSSGCNSSPQFISNPVAALTTSNKFVSCLAQSVHPDDSLYYRFISLMTSSSTPVTYANGYSHSSPFPGTATDPSNGPVIMHSKLGLIETDVQTGTSGSYNYGIVVEQWRNQVLIGEIERNAGVPGIFGVSSNAAPTVVLDTSMYPQVSQNGRIYNVEASPGDIIDFEMIATDNDYNSVSNQFQVITFTAYGRALDTIWNGIANYNSKPILSPVSPQTGFSSQLTNKINFNWVIAQEHVGMPHIFHFQFADDTCYMNGITDIILTVNVNDVANISADTSHVCQGDSIQLTGYTGSGNYLWSPAGGLSSATVAAPYASPSSSQYYYLEDPQNPGFKDSVYVDVTPSGTFTFAFNNGQLEITDNAQTTSRTWYYNGIPFAYSYDTLTPFGLGDYYVVGRVGACRYVTDTVTVTSGMSFSVTNTGNGSFNGAILPLTGSLGVTFHVNQNVNVSSVSIPGIADLYGKTGGYDLKLQVFDDTQTEIFSSDIVLHKKPIDDVLKINGQFTLNANTDYTIAVSGDTGYAFSLYENVQLPATPHNVGFTVKSAAEGVFGQFPTAPTAYLLPISLGIDQTVGIGEPALPEWQIYPNPATAQVSLSSLQDAQTVELIDVSGKIIRSYSLRKDQNDLEITKAGLPSGLYFVKVHSGNTTSVKKVLFH